MIYSAVAVRPGEKKGTVLVEDHSLDYLVSKFVAEACKRAKKAHQSLHAGMGKVQILLMDQNDECYGMIIAAETENNPKGVLLVQLDGRNVLMIYNHKGHLVSKNSI